MDVAKSWLSGVNMVRTSARYLILAVSIVCCGCSWSEQGRLARRFQDSEPNSTSTIQLTERYSQLVETVGALRLQNQQLTDQNARLKAHLQQLENDLAQAQVELNQANTLLMEMLGELNNWKKDVLGFRDEIRQAAKAQMEALVKILEALGAQSTEEGQGPGTEGQGQ